jgi:hypothetical protein
MRRLDLGVLATCGALLLGTTAWAQSTYPYVPPQYGPGYQTPLSPYLNFLRGGDPAANYFLGVIPEFQRRENAAQFRNQIQGLQILTAPLRNPSELLEQDLPRGFIPSGHAAGFNYTGTFFGSVLPAARAPGARTPGTPFTR